MTVPGHYHGTIMAPSWILKSRVLKIDRNYDIVSAEIKRKFTVPPDMIFLPQFGILTGNQTGTKGKHLNIQSSIQPGTEGQHPQHKTRYPNSYRRLTTPI